MLDSAPPIDHAAAPVSLTTSSDYTPAALDRSLHKLLEPLGLRSHFGSVERVLIKVGLIQACPPDRHITPTPAFLCALIKALRTLWPRSEIILADGSGNERDSERLLCVSGLQEVLDQMPFCRFIDLNIEDTVVKPVRNGWTFEAVAVPRLLDEVDVFVSLAKLKAHHWAGVTLCMKNLFGVLPGAVYGYPKNTLHWASIPRVIADLVSTLPPDLCIIDGIIGVEGNGPLDGKVRQAGVLVASTDPVACDGVGTRCMGYSPYLVPQFWYVLAGNAHSLHTETIDERVEAVQTDFAAPPTMPWLFRSASLSRDRLLEKLKELPFVPPLDSEVGHP